MSRLPIVLIVALCLAGACSALSIDKTPVKVTHRNSGPRYDLEEEVDRSKLTPVSQSAPEASETATSNTESNRKREDGDKEAEAADQAPIGHISIRRIFLVPMVRPRPEWQEEAGESGSPSSRQPSDESESQERPAMFAKPFWPFLTPARPSHPSHHVFGADEASRSPSAMRPQFHRGEAKPERDGERESEPQESRPAGDGREQLMDPIQMMLEMMQQAINSQITPPMQPNSPDLNKEASSRGDNKPDGEQASEERPKIATELAKPSATNETREDIVEIEGKKYLRKAVINRHVGENIIFMTKRLIFVPLNETTDSGSEQQSTPTTTSSSEAPPTTTVASSTVSEAASTTTAASEMPTEEDKSSTEKPAEESTITTTATPTTEAATEPTTERASTTRGSFAERVSEAIGKMERMIDGGDSGSSTTTTPSTTEKPASS